MLWCGGGGYDAQLQELEILVRSVVIGEVEFEEYGVAFLGVDGDC